MIIYTRFCMLTIKIIKTLYLSDLIKVLRGFGLITPPPFKLKPLFF